MIRLFVIVLEIRNDEIRHQLLIALRHGGRCDAELCGNLLALESFHENHLQNDGACIVSAETVVAQALYHSPYFLPEVGVRNVEHYVSPFHAFLETFAEHFLFLRLQLVEDDESESVYHPCAERYSRLAVVELLPAVAVEREIIFVGDGIEVHPRLESQVILLVTYAVSHPAVSIEELSCNAFVLVAQTVDDFFVSQFRSICSVFLFHSVQI